MLGLALAPMNLAVAQKKKDAPPAKPAVDSDKLPSGDISGVLKSVPGTDRMFQVEMETKRLLPTGGKVGTGNNNINQLLQAQNQVKQAQTSLLRAKSPQQKYQAQQRVLQAQIRAQQAVARLNNGGGGGKLGAGGAPAGYKWDVTKQVVDVQAKSDWKIRTLVLGENYNDKGELVKWTAEQLAELKGKDKNLPGYESSSEKLEVGQTVTVTLVSVPAAKAAPKADADKADRDEVKADEDNKRMQVKLILIRTEAKGGGGTTPAPKKKAK